MSKGISEEEVLKAVKENQPVGTKEVGKVLGIARQSADYRLRQLEEKGEVESKMVGRTLIWMLASED